MLRTTKLGVLTAAGLAAPVYYLTQIQDRTTQQSILVSALVSLVAFWACRKLIPLVARFTLRADLYGLDINKKGTEAGEKKIPESLGLAVGAVYLVCIAFFQLLHFNDSKEGRIFRPGSADEWLVEYNAALASVCFMLFLGFADDVLDIPWRTKILMPIFASLPLVVAYSGRTDVLVPKPLRFLLPHIPFFQTTSTTVNLGVFYYLAAILVVVFCTNSINILAGVNGLEAGQTFLVACGILTFNLQTLVWAGDNESLRDAHLFSSYLMIPLAATTMALLTFNWYPSQVFVGDTFTYFAGMVIAVAGVLGHFTETLLIFLLPQLFNFVYSVPQLFGWVPCPRHRLPKYDTKTGLLHYNPQYNLVNLTLKLFGSCTEEQLCIRILVLQGLSCVGAFVMRSVLTGWYK